MLFMKFIKALFSKTTIVVVLLFLQVTLLIGSFILLNEYFVIAQIVFRIMSLVVFFNIINKKQSPEFKLPWIFVVLVLPLFGSFIYIMFNNQKLTKKQTKFLTEISEKMTKSMQVSEEKKREMNDYLGDYSYLENYNTSTSEYSGHLGNRVKYYKQGEEFFEDLLIELKKAKDFIFMEYFIIDNGYMWNTIYEILKEKVKQGVEVRVMYDDLGTIGKVKRNFYKKLRKEGIDCYKFNPFVPVISAVHNNRDHRKITIIDGKVGFTGGLNIADEYINKKKLYGHWKDSAVKIEGSAVRNFTSMFLQMYDMNSQKISDYDKYLNVEIEKFDDEGYVIPFGDGPKPFFKYQIGEGNFLNIINNAKKYVYITTPYLIIDYSLTTALKNAALRGVDVRIITPHIPDKRVIFKITQSNYEFLIEAGVKIYEYTPGFIHAKSIISDDIVAFVGSINFDYRSLVHHFETGAIMYKTPCIADIKNDFDKTLKSSMRIENGKFKRRLIVRFVCSILNLFSPML